MQADYPPCLYVTTGCAVVAETVNVWSMAPYSMSFQHTPEILRRILAPIPPDRHSDRLSPDRFSLVEMVAHLADWEPILRGRIETALRTPGADVAAYDEGERAVDLNYAARDLAQELEVFATERARTFDLVSGLSEVQWRATFRHPERGILTVQDQVTMLLGHDLYHLEQATQYGLTRTLQTES